MSRLAGLGLLAPIPFVAGGADFDGTNDYMTRGAGLTGAADSKTGMLSTWFRIDGGDGTQRRILCATTAIDGLVLRFDLRLENTNKPSLSLWSTAGAVILTAGTVNTYLAGSGWHHALLGWDMNGAGTFYGYLDGASDWSVSSNTDATIDYTNADWAVGGIPDGSNKMDGCVAEIWFAPGQLLDLSVAANRLKFRDGRGKPANLGPDGSWPTGTAPSVYHRIRSGETVANFATNQGGGGAFSIRGALSAASDSPSD